MLVLASVFAVVFVVIDQLTKAFLYGKSFSLIGNIVWIESAFNDGAAFSMLSGAKWFFIILSLPVMAVILYLLISKKLGNSKFLGISFGLILAGIIGNVIDRIIYSGVRDFIYLKFINFAIFNVADMCICVGAVLFAIYLLFIYKPLDKGKEVGKS